MKLTVAPNYIQYWWCNYSIEFQKLVVKNQSYRVNFPNIGGAYAPAAYVCLVPLEIEIPMYFEEVFPALSKYR